MYVTVENILSLFKKKIFWFTVTNATVQSQILLFSFVLHTLPDAVILNRRLAVPICKPKSKPNASPSPDPNFDPIPNLKPTLLTPIQMANGDGISENCPLVLSDATCHCGMQTNTFWLVLLYDWPPSDTSVDGFAGTVYARFYLCTRRLVKHIHDRFEL